MKKKSVLLFILGALSLTLFACGSKGTVTKFQQEQDGNTLTMSITAKDDIITRIDQETVVNIEDLGDDELTQLDDSVAEAKKNLTSIKGVTYSSTKSATTFTEKIGMPTDKATLKKLIADGLLPVEGENVSQLSFKQTKKLLEDSGWTVE